MGRGYVARGFFKDVQAAYEELTDSGRPPAVTESTFVNDVIEYLGQIENLRDQMREEIANATSKIE